MLPSEIEPFAQAHIEAIAKIREEMLDLPVFVGDETYEITHETLNRWREELTNTRHAFFRFQMCMIDEHKMKERLQEKNLHCRLNHKD